MYTSGIFSVYLHSYHVEYTTDVGFPEEKTALAWSFRADLKQRSLLLRPGIDDGVPNSVPTHTVLRAHVVRSVCVSFAFVFAFVGSLTALFSLCTHIHPRCFLFFLQRTSTSGDQDWSLPTPVWKVAGSCDTVQQYLVDEEEHDMQQWYCTQCPTNAHCTGAVLWKG